MKPLTKPDSRDFVSVVEAYRLRHQQERVRDLPMEELKAFYRRRDGDDGVSDDASPGRQI